LLHLFKHMLGEVPLESYHSWTRASKAITHAKLRQHYEQQHEPGSQMQLQMVAHLLSSISLKQQFPSTLSTLDNCVLSG